MIVALLQVFVLTGSSLRFLSVLRTQNDLKEETEPQQKVEEGGDEEDER